MTPELSLYAGRYTAAMLALHPDAMVSFTQPLPASLVVATSVTGRSVSRQVLTSTCEHAPSVMIWADIDAASDAMLLACKERVAP